MLVASQHELPVDSFWGSNEQTVKVLQHRLGLAGPVAGHTFPAGSIYWVRLAALAPLFETLTPSEFDDERGQVDGTLAHAAERVIAACVRDLVFKVQAADVPKASALSPSENF